MNSLLYLVIIICMSFGSSAEEQIGGFSVELDQDEEFFGDEIFDENNNNNNVEYQVVETQTLHQANQGTLGTLNYALMENGTLIGVDSNGGKIKMNLASDDMIVLIGIFNGATHAINLTSIQTVAYPLLFNEERIPYDINPVAFGHLIEPNEELSIAHKLLIPENREGMEAQVAVNVSFRAWTGEGDKTNQEHVETLFNHSFEFVYIQPPLEYEKQYTGLIIVLSLIALAISSQSIFQFVSGTKLEHSSAKSSSSQDITSGTTTTTTNDNNGNDSPLMNGKTSSMARRRSTRR